MYRKTKNRNKNARRLLVERQLEFASPIWTGKNSSHILLRHWSPIWEIQRLHNITASEKLPFYVNIRSA